MKLPTYTYYQTLFQKNAMPFAFIDLDLLEINIQQIKKRAGNKNIRIASKSIRCTEILRRIFAADAQFQGVMAYTPSEAVFLYEQGFDDILVAYPCWQEQAIQQVCETLQQNARIVLMVDRLEHVTRLNALGKKYDTIIPICIDVDMSSRFPGLHFGVYRSSIHNVQAIRTLLKSITQADCIQLKGVMGYEAQIAGVGDQVKGQKVMNQIIQLLKKWSIPEIQQRRSKIVRYIQQAGFNLDFVNGGGTGSLESTAQENVVTEVTVGSGFYCPTLFDGYKNFTHLPAAAYALEIVRSPQEHIYTCAGGGYPASGKMEKSKSPQPYLPLGCQLTENEGAGEVQTPVRYIGKESLALGDPIFMRAAKAGELCERFNHLFLVSKGKIVDKVPTYRGMGQCFL